MNPCPGHVLVVLYATSLLPLSNAKGVMSDGP